MPDAVYVRDAFARIADRYVMTNHVLSLWVDVWWRNVLAKRVKEVGPKRLLDVASGTGDLALEIQRQCVGCDVVASDFCAEMLSHASARGVKETLVADALALPFEGGEFDAVTVAFGLRNMSDYGKALREMRRVIKTGGRIWVLDFSMPEGLLRIPYRLYLHRVLPILAGLLTREKGAYEYLGGSIEAFPAGRAMCDLLEQSGFEAATVKKMTFGVVSLYEAVAKEFQA